jgi:hypothetical protein
MLKHTVKILSAALGASIVLAAPAFAAHHKDKAISAQAMAYDSNTVLSYDGKALGADPDPNIRFAVKREAGNDGD